MRPRVDEKPLGSPLLLVLSVLLSCGALAGQGGAALAEPPTGLAQVSDVPAGERRSGDLVVLGRAVDVAGELEGNLVVTRGRLKLTGRVSGDVILILADADVGPTARIGGDLLSVGGDLRVPAGSAVANIVGGRLVTLDAMESAFLSELRTSPLESLSVSPLLLSFRLLILTGWLAAGLALLFVKPRRVSEAARAARGRLPFLTALGVTAALTAVLLSTLLLRFAPAKLGFALVLLVLGALALAKLFGLIAVFLLLGRWLGRHARRGTLLFGDPAALSLGVLALGLVSLLPAAGTLVWWLASFAGIGLTLSTAFGRPGGSHGATPSGFPPAPSV